MFFGSSHAIHCGSPGIEDLPVHAPFSRPVTPFHAPCCRPLSWHFVRVFGHARDQGLVPDGINHTFRRKTGRF